MKSFGLFSALIGLLIPPAGGAPAQPNLTGFPFTNEALHYTINWPSGLGLGEGHMLARRSASGWNFELKLDAGIPAFMVNDTYTAQASSDFCSSSLTKRFEHGQRKGGEDEIIDRSTESASRTTIGNGGGKSEFSVPDCIKDALTFLYYARRELGQGRVPPAQQVLFGALYQTRLDYAGAQTIQVAGNPMQTDKIVCTMSGPSSGLIFEIYFARDPARTPLLFKVPIGGGRFSMELVR